MEIFDQKAVGATRVEIFTNTIFCGIVKAECAEIVHAAFL